MKRTTNPEAIEAEYLALQRAIVRDERRIRARMAAHLRDLADRIDDLEFDAVKKIARLCRETGIPRD